MESDKPTLILASTSRYRRDLLQRLRVPFETVAPHVEESPAPGESPQALARRLAREKAQAVARQRPGAWVIGSDQVADVGGQPVGKPGTHERATEQLRAMSGQTVAFHTALAVVRYESADRFHYVGEDIATVTVRFRTLGADEIERYLRLEQPYDCAGSAKCETLGIALLEEIENDDPTALVGLPLIRTCRLLREAGFDVLSLASEPATDEAGA